MATLETKTCMITGASSGIGLATAVELARRGMKLFLVCRDRGRGETTRAKILAETGNRSVELMLADLSSQQSIRRLATDFLARSEPLHVLVNNAGILNLRRSVTVDGIEAVFAVNHLGYFLLTLLLLDRLRESAPARIVNVASGAHHGATIDFDDLGGERRYRPMRIYGQSKLANVLFTFELARRLEGSGVTVNCLHPGVIATRLGSNNGPLARLAPPILKLLFRSPEDGAATSVYLACSPEVEGTSGKYFVDCRTARSSKESCDATIARRLWEVSARLTGADLSAPVSTTTDRDG